MINYLVITKSLINRRRPDFEFTVFNNSPVTPLSKPLNKCKLSIVTTGGIHLKNDIPFDLSLKDGDCTYRILPKEISLDEIAVSHKWYNHKFINKDINCVFPIDRMKEYVQKGVIHSISEEHLSFMGHIYFTAPLLKQSLKAGRYLKKLGVDIAFLTPT
ncbi:MAG: glycine/sarcosine/betaine reductase selenoprotein B family protein [Nitrospirota bacterium]